MLRKNLPFIALVGILFLFILIRIKSLQFQTVGYTYDQGRDFLKVAEMITSKRPTFIGPTTGINGLYHGAWWYYVLTMPFLLFKGSPIGFYYFNFFIQIGLLTAVFLFLKKYFSNLIAILFGLVVALSPYFIFTSLFVGNNIMVLPVMLGFLTVNFIIFEDKKIQKPLILSLLTGLFLGLTGEFELSLGLFLIPTYFLALFIFKKLRDFYAKLPNLTLFLLGLGIVFMPRFLFEIKNKFLQTKVLLSFFFKPKFYDPKPYADVIKDRLVLFRGYYEELFPNIFFTLLFTMLLIILLIFFYRNKTKMYTKSLLFLSYLVGMLFLLSTLYRDSFWRNYYDGIQYIFIFIISIILLTATKAHLWGQYGKKAIILLLIFMGLYQIIPSWQSSPKYEGLAVQRAVVAYILTHEKNTDNYCVRIYTPPVIPYTYNYLFTYEKMKGKIALPGSEWVNGTCWFIMEQDPYKFRLNEWKKVNEPERKAIVTSKKIQEVLINHYEVIQ